MDSDGTRALALVGLSNHDLFLIKSLAKLSGGRPRKYRVAPSDERANADVFIVNGDDAFALQEAKNLVGQRPAKVIQVRKEARAPNGHPTMILPLHAKVVYGTLDSRNRQPCCRPRVYSTVTDFARLRGLSTSVPLCSAA